MNSCTVKQVAERRGEEVWKSLPGKTVKHNEDHTYEIFNDRFIDDPLGEKPSEPSAAARN